jgi:hypothetical protein
MRKQSFAAILGTAILSGTTFSATAQTASATPQPIVVAQDESGGATSGGATSGGAASAAPAPAPVEAAPPPSETQELPAGPAATPQQAGFYADPLWVVGGALVVGVAVCAAVCFSSSSSTTTTSSH